MGRVRRSGLINKSSTFRRHVTLAPSNYRVISEIRWACREFADSPVEESGFEPLVPLTLNQANAGEREEKIAMSPLRRIG